LNDNEDNDASKYEEIIEEFRDHLDIKSESDFNDTITDIEGLLEEVRHIFYNIIRFKNKLTKIHRL